MKWPAVFDRYRSAIDTELGLVFADRQSPLYDMMRYHLGWIEEKGNLRESLAGKALRPTLCLLACEAINRDYNRALPAAAAIELVHNFSLIHDDIQDDDRERRHRHTVWSIWGKPQAINAGTAMHILASLALSRLSNHNIPVTQQLHVRRLIDESSLKLIEGQYLDIDYESRFDINVRDYINMIEKKTAALITCSLETGVLLGGDDNQLIKSFRTVGRNLGLIFQIKDDILGIWGNKAKTGKPLGSDIRRRKKTLPVIYALDKGKETQRKKLEDMYGNGLLNDNDVATFLTILESVHAQQYAQKTAEMYCRKAIEAIDKLPILLSAKHEMKEVAYFLLERSF